MILTLFSGSFELHVLRKQCGTGQTGSRGDLRMIQNLLCFTSGLVNVPQTSSATRFRVVTEPVSSGSMLGLSSLMLRNEFFLLAVDAPNMPPWYMTSMCRAMAATCTRFSSGDRWSSEITPSEHDTSRTKF